MCSSIYHHPYVVDLSFSLSKGKKKRAANVYAKEQHLEVAFKNSTGRLRLAEMKCIMVMTPISNYFPHNGPYQS
jgi:hypothetical protein